MTYSTQDSVFALLGDPASHGGEPVRRIDTHAAVVFLAGARAYKIKRAVRFPFLDYSTLERRKAACAAELEVNRLFAPALYLRVVAITREAGGALALDGDGEAVEWAVEMRRFDETCTLDHLAGHGGIDAAMADQLASAVARAHAGAPIVDGEPWIAALGQYLDQNEAALRERPALFAPEAANHLIPQARAALARVTPLLQARGRRGLIRRGHGDLHLGNIALIDGKPVPFDAIEFDPLIASGDVLYDLAFLLMDLVERGLPGPANVVLNRYLAETQRLEDLDALTALPLFLALRAAIRAMVTAARLKVAPESECHDIEKAAASYFRLALDLIAPPPPVVVAIGGLSGTGKSVLARALAPNLAPAPGAVVLRSDSERKALFGHPENARLPAEAYAADVTDRVFAILDDKTRRAAAAGHSVIADAVFVQPRQRDSIAAAAAGRRFVGLYLRADLATRLDRVGARRNDASDATVEIALQQEEYQAGASGWIDIDASGTPDQTLARALACLCKT